MPFLTEVLMTKAHRGRGQLYKFGNYLPRKIYEPQTAVANSVKEVGDRKNLNACIQEMSVMLACFKKHDFSEQLCTREIQSYRQCLAAQKEKEQRKEDMETKGVYRQTGRLPPTQLNALLRRFPNPPRNS